MVNSGDPSKNCASLQSYYSRRKASWEPQQQSKQPVAGKFFRQPLLQRVGTPPRSPEAKAPLRCKNLRHYVPHAPPLSLTCRRVRARNNFSDGRTSSPESPAANLLAYIPGFLVQHLNLHFFLYFVSSNCTFLGFLDFSNTQ